MKRIVLYLSLIIFLAACNQVQEKKNLERESLKTAFNEKFYMGVAMNSEQIYEKDSMANAVILKHFNSIVAENCMKGERIQPEEGKFYWEEADAFVDFGEKNDMFIIGHCLVWHSQAPPWIFTDENGNDVSREVLIERMKTHISTVVNRYKGRVDAWDVVNEAIDDDGSMRESKYYTIIGPEWVELAFKFAQETDPDAELYYNDYSMAKVEKADAVYNLVKDLQNKGLKVTGIGMQGHSGIPYPDLQDFEESIVKFSELGKVMITELDITVLPWPGTETSAEISISHEFQEKYNPFSEGLTDSMSIILNNRYVDFFELFNKHSDKINRVTLWGVHDAQSWRNYWPINGRKDFPLLFNRDYSQKPAVQRIIDLSKEN